MTEINLSATVTDDTDDTGQRRRVVRIDLADAFEGTWDDPQLIGWGDMESEGPEVLIGLSLTGDSAA